MKLYIWNSPFHIAYGGSCLYVIAPNLTAARKAALKSFTANFGDVWRPETTKLENLGPPTRVESGPYAEVYRWEE